MGRRRQGGGEGMVGEGSADRRTGKGEGLTERSWDEEASVRQACILPLCYGLAVVGGVCCVSLVCLEIVTCWQCARRLVVSGRA